METIKKSRKRQHANGKTAISDPKLTKSRGRPQTQRTLNLDAALVAIVQENQPISSRGAYYRAEVLGLVDKTPEASKLIGRRLLSLRRKGSVPYEWIVDESRDVYGHTTYDGPNDLISDVAALYRRDYWLNSNIHVQIWIEKRALSGVLSPIVVDKWGLNLYVCGGQPSETYLWRAGQDIINREVETQVYILSDFDPGGETIFETIAHGTKKAPGGLSRFTGGVPVHVHQLALTEEQVKAWELPTRKCKRTDRRAAKFMAKHGDLSGELDAIAPPDLRDLVDQAIAQHFDPRELAVLKETEKQERELLPMIFQLGQETHEREQEWIADQYREWLSEQPPDDDEPGHDDAADGGADV